MYVRWMLRNVWAGHFLRPPLLKCLSIGYHVYCLTTKEPCTHVSYLYEYLSGCISTLKDDTLTVKFSTYLWIRICQPCHKVDLLGNPLSIFVLLHLCMHYPELKITTFQQMWHVEKFSLTHVALCAQMNLIIFFITHSVQYQHDELIYLFFMKKLKSNNLLCKAKLPWNV